MIIVGPFISAAKHFPFQQRRFSIGASVFFNLTIHIPTEI